MMLGLSVHQASATGGNRCLSRSPQTARPDRSDMDRVGERAFPAILDEQAILHGEQPFIVHEDADGTVTTRSFRELHGLTLGYAAVLQAAGVAKGDRVFVFLRNTADFIPLWFGIMSAGAVMVPGNIYLTAPEVEYQVTLTDPVLIVTESRFLPLMREVVTGSGSKVMLRTMDACGEDGGFAEFAAGAEGFVPVANESNDLAQIIFTSGTSARPKGVMHTHANLIWCGISGAANTGLSPSDRSFNNKPLFHVNCQETVLSCLVAGATAIIGERYSASRYVDQLVRHRATICSLSAMICRTLLNQPVTEDDRSHSIRFAGYGINISDPEMAAFVERFGMRIRNGYGQSESMVYITVESITSPSTYPSIGRPGLEREVFVVDADDNPLPPGEVGEIVVRGRPGRNLMLGYYRDERATREAFRGGWLHTRDLGAFDAAGNLHFHGRLGDMIKRAGENVSVQEVEHALMGHGAVADAAVIGIPDRIRDQAVKAYVVLRAGHEATAEEIREFCRSRLAYFKVPEFIAFVPSLPRNAIGKVLKRELEALAHDVADAGRN